MIPIKDDNPTTTRPVLTVSLIVSCCLVFLWQLAQTPQEVPVFRFGMIPAVLLGRAELDPDLAPLPSAVTLVTSMFLHGSWMHLIGNMLYLWIFGNNVEDRLGRRAFVAFYLGCGIIAALGQVASNPLSPVPMIGASGAVSGVLGAYLVWYPRASVLVLVPIFILVPLRLAAGWLLGLCFVFQLVPAVAGPAEGAGVAFWAHVAGFVAGVVIAVLLRSKRSNAPMGPWGPRR